MTDEDFSRILASLSVELGRLFLCLSLTGLVFISYHIVKKTRRRSKYNAHIPGLKVSWYDALASVWLVPYRERSRNGYSLQTSLLQIIAGLSKLFQNEQLVHAMAFYHPIVLANKAKAVEEILTDTTMLDKGWFYTFITPILGDGVLTSLPNKWKPRRKLLNPCLHFEILLEYMSIFNAQASILVNNLLAGKDDEIKELLEPITLCVVDNMCQTIMGTKIGAQKARNKEYVNSAERISKISMERIVTWYLWFELTFRFSRTGKLFYKSLKVSKDFTNMVLQQKKKEYLSGEAQKSERKRKSLMDLLLEHHIERQTLSEKDIREEVDTFFAAGNDTTATTITSALYFLGRDKEIQSKVHQELDTIFDGDKERHADKEDLVGMKYTECVIKETLRLFPSAPIFARRVPAGKTVCGYNIPEGATCAIVPYVLHRDPEAFPDPEKFDPSRFFPENSSKRHSYAYVPFSAGPRGCIGRTFAMMEIKIVLAALLRNFTVESLDPRDKLEPCLGLALRPSIPLRFRLKRRM